jgi:hypothetical protein
MGDMRYAYKILIGKTEGKRPLRRPRHIGEDNIRMDFGWEDAEWTGLDLSVSG